MEQLDDNEPGVASSAGDPSGTPRPDVLPARKDRQAIESTPATGGPRSPLHQPDSELPASECTDGAPREEPTVASPASQAEGLVGHGETAGGATASALDPSQAAEGTDDQATAHTYTSTSFWVSPTNKLLVITAVLSTLLAAMVGVFVGHVLWRPSQIEPGGPLGLSPVGNSAFPGTASSVSRVAQALVDINTTLGYQNGQAAGTGMVLTKGGEVITNNHVVEGATALKVTDLGNGKTYSATVVGYDRLRDVAVLQLRGAKNLTTIPTTATARRNLRVGSPILALGNAGGVGGPPSAATGDISGLNKAITAQDSSTGVAEHLTGMIATSADILPGDSGGALVNGAGQVIGMNTAASTTPVSPAPLGATLATQGYAIPLRTVLTVANQIVRGSAHPSRVAANVHVGPTAFLGVEVTTATSSRGAHVAGVLPGFGAAHAGIVAGDTIIGVGGHPVTSAQSLQSALDSVHPGSAISIVVAEPNGGQHTYRVQVSSGPPQ